MKILESIKSISTVTKISILNRIFAYPFSAGIILGYYHGTSDILIWGFMVVTFLVAPSVFIAALLLGKSYTRTEQYICVAEAALIGSWLPLLSFSLLPMVALITAVIIANGSIGGVVQLIKGLTAFTVFVLFVGMWTNYYYSPIANPISSIFSIAYLFSLITIISCFQNYTLKSMRSKYNILGYSNKLFEKLSEIQHKVNSFENIDDSIAYVKDAIFKQFSFDTLIVYTIDRENQVIKSFRSYSDVLDQSKLQMVSKIDYILDERETIMAFVAQSRTVSFDNSISINKTLVGDRKLYELTDLKSQCILPLTAFGKVLGCMGIYSHSAGKISESDVQILTNLTEPLGGLLDKHMFSEKFKHISNEHSKMKQTYDTLKSNLDNTAHELGEKNSIISTLKSKLNKYLPEPVSESILQESKQVTKMERRYLTILMVDIACLTDLSKESSYEYYNNVFHDYLQVLSAVVYKHRESIIYKILESKAIIVFGTKGETSTKELSLIAAESAMEIREDIQKQMRVWSEKGVIKDIGFKASIHGGYCAIGFLDSDNLIEYLIAGDEFHNAVELINSAHENIIVSSPVKECLEKNYAFLKAKEVKVLKKIKCYTLLSTLDEFKNSINLSIPGFELKIDLDKVENFDEANEILKALDKAEAMMGKF